MISGQDKAREGTPAEGGHKAVLANVVPLAEKTTFIKDGDSSRQRHHGDAGAGPFAGPHGLPCRIGRQADSS